MRTSAAVLAIALLATPAAAQQATVTDGDTFKMNGTTYRLWGIDAAESKQLCGDGWPAGRAATTYLRELVRDHVVTCEAKSTDRYGRTVALCRADGVDIGAEMVRNGMALAFTRYSIDYLDHELEAKAAGRGVHARECEAPWAWRAGQKAEQH